MSAGDECAPYKGEFTKQSHLYAIRPRRRWCGLYLGDAAEGSMVAALSSCCVAGAVDGSLGISASENAELRALVSPVMPPPSFLFGSTSATSGSGAAAEEDPPVSGSSRGAA